MDENNKEISKYNEGLRQIDRLHYLWLKIQPYTEDGNYNPRQWKFLQDSVWRELRADVEKHIEKDEMIKENLSLITKIREARTQDQLYQALNDRHEFLKILQDKVGKGGRYEYANESDFE